MTSFRQKLLAAAIACFVSLGTGSAFAQKRGGDKQRPPKPDSKVVAEQKRDKPPPQNKNQGDKRNDGKKGKP